MNKTKLVALLQKPGMRYLIVGGSVYVLELIIIVIAQHLGASPELAVAISFCLGTAVSFLLQKFFTFSDNRMHHTVVAAQVIAISLLLVFNLGFSVLLTKLLDGIVPAVVARTLALGITTIWNFYLYKTRIFAVPETV